jgi:hypothetical protein
MISIIEHELGRELDVGLRNSVPTLNDITSEMLLELRQLPPDTVNTYLRFHLRPGSETAFEDFTRDVIRGEIDPRTWGYCDRLALVDERDRGAALMMSADQLRETLSAVEGERWARYSVEDAREVNRIAYASWGAPGVLVRHAPYWWTPPRKEVMGHLGMRAVEAVSEAGFVVAFRRWIAFRVSWWVRFRDLELATASARQVVEAIGVDMDRVSADGMIALSALLREAQSAFDPDTQVRGYIGPDEWFAK